MSETQTIEIPDIGNFESVDVIDVLVNIGDKVSKEDPLLTVESDKASMDIPSPFEGNVSKILVKIGDKVKQGSSIIILKATDTQSPVPENSSLKTKHTKNNTKTQASKRACKHLPRVDQFWYKYAHMEEMLGELE